MIAIIILVVTAISMVATIVWTVYFEENHMRQVIRDYIENIRGDLEEVQKIAHKISSSEDWKRELINYCR